MSGSTLTALLCSASPLDAELCRTVLWRSGVNRQAAGSAKDARVLAAAARPRLIVVDRDLPGAVDLVAALRRDSATRGSSVVVVARGEFEASEVEFLEVGANAILRLPPTGEWDERLDRLLNVPARRESRFGMTLRVDAYGQGPVEATALNLSLHGMLVHSASPLTVGDDLRFWFGLAGTAIQGGGRVVRVDGPDQFGVAFTRLDGRAVEAIRRHVAVLPAV